MTDTVEPGPQPTPAGPAQIPRLALILPRWLRFVPFFMSALLFLSAFFAAFSPLPVLLVHFRSGRRWAWCAALTNLAIVVGLSGAASGAVYGALVLALALAMPELLLRRCSLEKTGVLTLLAMGLTGAAALGTVAVAHHTNPWQEIRSEVASTLEVVSQSLIQGGQGGRQAWMDPADFEEWKARIWTELPSSLAIFSMVLVWANLLILLRLNPKDLRSRLGLAPDFVFTWKAPDWLIWPTILCGIFVVVDAGRVSMVAVNFFKIFMAVYVIQGLSVLGFFLNLWKIRGLLRTLAYAAMVLLLLPLLLGLGFFDLWFDFRSRFRQS